MSNPTEQAKAVELPKPGPALPNAGKPSESTLPASPKENLQAQAEKPLLSEKVVPVSPKADEAKPETRSQAAESLEQTKAQPLAEANATAPAVVQTPAEPKPVNPHGLQGKVPAQEPKTSTPPSGIGNAQQPAAGSEIKAQTQPSVKPDPLADQSEAAPKPKEVTAVPSPIAPVKKKDASGGDADPSHQK
jgi:hypothetical protein